MSGSGESDEGERLSDLDEIAEALRAGELDTTTRFGKRRSERADDRFEESDERSPNEILADLRTQDDEADQSEERATIVVELVIQLERDELVPKRIKEQLLQQFSSDLPPDSIEIREIHELAPDRNQIEVHMTVCIDGGAVVEELLADSQSDSTPDPRVKRVT